MNNRILRTAGLTLGLLLVAGGGVRADNYETNFSLPSDAAVTITSTDPSNPSVSTSPENTWAVPFTMTDTSTNASFTGFCIDLYHNVSNGETTTNNPEPVTVAGAQGAGATTAGTTASPFPNYSAFTTDLGSKLNYLGGLYLALTNTYGSDAYVQGAVQLAIWALTDSKFVATNEASGMAADFATIMSLIGGPGTNGAGVTNLVFDTTSGSTTPFSYLGYSTSELGHYASEGGAVLLVHSSANGSGDIQNVITWSPSLTTQGVPAAPEPSTFALAGMGALGLIGYGLRRRSRA